MTTSIPILMDEQGVLAVNKPAGLNVHAAPGRGASLLHVLEHQLGLELTPVHRLDRDASGVLLLAKERPIAAALQNEWETVRKTYWALCDGVPVQAEGAIEAPILEHQSGKPERLRNAVRYFQSQNPRAVLPPLPEPRTSAVHVAGRPSRTEYTVLEAFGIFAALAVRPQQGRMHQIRVHLAHSGHPLAVDQLYGKRGALLDRDVGGTEETVLLARMPLHAQELRFNLGGQMRTVIAPLPDDLTRLVERLRTQVNIGL
jgi:23S rRNA-/tRNA-specific pseudouridylate synthase